MSLALVLGAGVLAASALLAGTQNTIAPAMHNPANVAFIFLIMSITFFSK
ncbi:MAG: hypothetical protein Q4G62_04615 [Pseudomonadota bacterium]|nr:hypothetical protein [Pseudomonadota bacterium]